LIDETDIVGMSEKERTTFRLNTLGYVFQDYALVPDLSARENVMMPLLMRGEPWATASTTADKALDDVGLEGKYLNLPSMLSGGEQQRVAVARAIAGKPKILFADEPTANLDSISGTQVIKLLKELHNQGQTIVMVTHEEEYARYCDRIIYIKDGMLAEKPTT
jgi:putative ABC transport system ATP-binding protein